MTWLPTRIGKSGAFVLLMLAAMVSLLLPPRWSDSLKHLTQLFVPAQAVVYRAGIEATRAVGQLDSSQADPKTREQWLASQRALENQIVFQDGMIESLRRENASLRGLRERLIPPDVRLIPARVVARDVAASRDTLLVSRGGMRGVARSDWAVSRVFVDRGADDGVERSYAVLAREFLIGRIEQVSPYMSRIALLTDADSRIAVRIGRVVRGKFYIVDYPCTLHGTGRQRMSIDSVPYDRVEMPADASTGSAASAKRGQLVNRMCVGDLVVSHRDELGLPAPLVIGRVTAIETDPRRRLVARVEVQPALGADELSDIFIVATNRANDDLLEGAVP